MADFIQTPNIVRGSAYAIFAFFCMAIFGFFTRAAYTPGMEIWVSFITYVIATIGCILLMPKKIVFLKSEHYGRLIGRAVFGTAASFLYMLSLNKISIINATLLFNTAPIFIPLLALFWLKIPVSSRVWVAVALGFLGIIAIIKPSSDIVTQPGNLIGLAAGLSLAIAYLLMKLLTATDPGLRIILYYFGIGTLLQIPLLFFTSTFPSMHSFLFSILSGIMLLLAQIGLVKAYSYAEASEVGISVQQCCLCRNDRMGVLGKYATALRLLWNAFGCHCRYHYHSFKFTPS